MWRKKEPLCTVDGNANWCKRVWRFLKKLKIESPYDPVISLLDIYSNNRKTLIQKDVCAPIFTAALFRIVNIWKQSKCSSRDKWMG